MFQLHLQTIKTLGHKICNVSLLKDALQALMVDEDFLSHTVCPSPPEGKVNAVAEVNESLSN